MRKSGYYWARLIGQHFNEIFYYNDQADDFCRMGYSSTYKYGDLNFEWIADEPIEEPKPKLIVGKYYIVQNNNNRPPKKSLAQYIIRQDNKPCFRFIGYDTVISPDWFEIVSEPFDIDDLVKHWGLEK